VHTIAVISVGILSGGPLLLVKVQLMGNGQPMALSLHNDVRICAGKARWWDRERRGAVRDVDGNGSWDRLTKACGHRAGIVEPRWVGEGGGSKDSEEPGVDMGDGAGGRKSFDNDSVGGDMAGTVPTKGCVAVALGW
jgi:hypothetical protein